MRLDLHDHAQTVTDVHRPRILSAPLGQNISPFGWQQSQQWLRVLVAAVLAPQGPEHAKLHPIRLAAKPLADEVVLQSRQGDRVERRLVDGHVFRIRGMRRTGEGLARPVQQLPERAVVT
jgi:hypothetical protein